MDTDSVFFYPLLEYVENRLSIGDVKYSTGKAS